MLVHLPDGYKPEQVYDALAAKIQTIPEILRASLTWTKAPEMRDWKQVSVAADIDVYFGDPTHVAACHEREHRRAAAPVLPQGHRPVTPQRTDHWVATEINDRPRKRLGFESRSRRSDRYCCNDRQNPGKRSTGRLTRPA